MSELNKTMYFGAKPSIIEKAIALRKEMTNAEKTLWNRLRNKQVLNLRFRRQHPIDRFIADFYCHAVRLVIEIDGGVHIKQRNYDKGRSGEMERFYIKTLRFTNEQIERDVEKVVKQIEQVIIQRFNDHPWII